MTSDESSSPQQTAFEPDKNQPGVLCSRCDHLNYATLEECEDCGAALYIDCPHCGERSPRVYTRCPHCRRRLRHRVSHGRRHGGKTRRSTSSTEKATRQLIWIVGVLFCLFAIAAFILMRLKG